MSNEIHAAEALTTMGDEGDEAGEPTSTDQASAGISGSNDMKEKKEVDEDVPMTFPQRLMEILSNDEHSEIISWLPHGKGFIIYQKKKFAASILPRYFKQSKFTSFTRKLNRWGFTRITRGPETGAYYHKYFVKGNSRLCMQMCCQSVKPTPQPSPPLMPVGTQPFPQMNLSMPGLPLVDPMLSIQNQPNSVTAAALAAQNTGLLQQLQAQQARQREQQIDLLHRAMAGNQIGAATAPAPTPSGTYGSAPPPNALMCGGASTAYSPAAVSAALNAIQQQRRANQPSVQDLYLGMINGKAAAPTGCFPPHGQAANAAAPSTQQEPNQTANGTEANPNMGVMTTTSPQQGQAPHPTPPNPQTVRYAKRASAA